jgi:tetratricopeptide (TPR) repeat protein
MQTESQQDHLGEVFNLLQQFVELNPEKARREMVYHLNRWAEMTPVARPSDSLSPAATDMLKTVSHVLPQEAAIEHLMRAQFSLADCNYLRDSFLFRQVSEWVDQDSSDDPLLASWFEALSKDRSAESVARLRLASRLFDWTIRNIAFEPLERTDPAPTAPPLPLGLTFRGPGYRQTNYETLWYGTGDALQRTGVFTQLCRQAGVPAAILGVPESGTGALKPWLVGVLIDEDIYLFEPGLGLHVPGPNQVGIATLAAARNDASVVRRLGVPGFFEYPFAKNDVQQCTALLNIAPDAFSPRLQWLEQGLTGERRLTLFADAKDLVERFDKVSGVAGVRLWDMGLLAEIYQTSMRQAAERDPMLAFYDFLQRGLLESGNSASQNLAKGRWAHLLGRFSNEEDDSRQGARTLYLGQRAPEFEIKDLRIDVELQTKYGVRRDLGITPEQYDQRVQQIQALMRLGKRSATYWLSLVQFDDGRFDTARTWLETRVLDETQVSQWVPAARYNLARALERIGDAQKAIELYKTVGDPQEHGNRVRARLLDHSSETP